MRIGTLLFLAGFFLFSLQAQESKKTIAVLEFQSAGGLEKNELSILTNRFRGILVQTNAFEVIERDKMGEILKEQDFAMSDQCNTSECAVQIGQLLGVQAMIAGDIGKFGQMYTIDIRMIDVGTGKILKTKTEDYRGELEGLLGSMRTIANSFVGREDGVAVAGTVGDIFVSSNPAGGKIFIDGKETGFVTPRLLEGITTGKHTVEVRSGDLIARKEIDLKKGAIENLDMKLGRITIPVKVTSDPDGAEIFLNNEKLGVTPTLIHLPAGSHVIVYKKSGYESVTDSVVIKEGESSKSIKTSLKKLYTLTVTPVLPEGATAKTVEITVNDRLRRNDKLSVSLPEGKHIIKITTDNKNIAEFFQAVNLTADVTIDAKMDYTFDYKEAKKKDEAKLLSEKQRLEKERQDKELKEQKKKEQEQLAMKQEMERKAKESKERNEKMLREKEAKEKSDKEAKEKSGTQVAKKSNMKWYIIGGAVVAGGGAAAVLMGGKKSSSEKTGINWPAWP